MKEFTFINIVTGEQKTITSIHGANAACDLLNSLSESEKDQWKIK